MPDNKLTDVTDNNVGKITDEEIKKALECCIKSSHFGDCFLNDCPFISEKGCKVGKETLYPYALDLINRLQTENEKLNTFAEIKKEEIVKIIARAKAEAYKECIEKVKEEIKQALDSNYKVRAERIEKHNVGETDDFISYCGGKIDCLRGLDDFLDNLLKEMVGEDK